MRVHIIVAMLILAGVGITLALFATGLTGETKGSASAAGDVAATIAFSKTTFAPGEPIDATFRLTNLGPDPATVVKPLVTPNLVFFRVIGPDAQTRLFLGPRLKLKAFQAEMFTELPVAGFTEQTFDLAPLYSFAAPGSYAITGVYRNDDDGSRFGFSALTTDGLDSNTVTIQVTG